MDIIFYDRRQAKQILGNNKKFIQYIDNIHPQTYYFKTGKIIASLGTYLNKLVSFTPEEKDNILNILNSLDRNNIINTRWEFIKLDKKMERGWPFTIDNYIILNSKMLRYNVKDIAYTLCHEKIHTLQSDQPTYFSKFIQKIGYSYLPVKGLNEIVNYANPDALQIEKGSWVYNRSKDILLPLMIFNGKEVKKKLFFLEKKDNNYLINKDKHIETIPVLSRLYPDAEPNHCYHPNEVLADIGGHYLLGEKLQSIDFTIFFDDLQTLYG